MVQNNQNNKNGGPPSEGQIVRVDAEIVKAELETQGSLALTRPRDELAINDKVRQLMEHYPAFAERCFYSYPRGGKQVIGISVVMARELARLWGNCTSGARIVSDNDDTFAVEGIFIDHQTNTRSVWPMTARKLVQRKNEYGDTVWRRPDARELVELMGMVAAKAQRNAILNALPQYLKEQWLEVARRIVAERMKQNMPQKIEQLKQWFAKYGVTERMLEEYIGKGIKDFTADDLTTLRGVAQGLNDGEYTVEQVFRRKDVDNGRVEGAPSAEQILGKSPQQADAQRSKPTSKAKNNRGGQLEMGYAKNAFRKAFIKAWEAQNNEKPDFRRQEYKDAANRLWHVICQDLFGIHNPETAEQVMLMAEEVEHYVVAEAVRIPDDAAFDEAAAKLEEAEREQQSQAAAQKGGLF